MRLDLVHDAQRLQVVLEPTVLLHEPVEFAFAAVAEGRVTEVVREAITSASSSLARRAFARLWAICATAKLCVSRVR